MTGTATTTHADIIDQLLGITPEGAIGVLRSQRPDIVRYAQGSYLALIEPVDQAGVSASERHLLALRVATLTGTPLLAAWHQTRLQQLGVSEETIVAIAKFPHGAQLSAREIALLRHVDRVNLAPSHAKATDLNELSAAGFTPRDIVIIAQLIGFVSFQTRTLTTLQLFGEES